MIRVYSNTISTHGFLGGSTYQQLSFSMCLWAAPSFLLGFPKSETQRCAEPLGANGRAEFDSNFFLSCCRDRLVQILCRPAYRVIMTPYAG